MCWLDETFHPGGASGDLAFQSEQFAGSYSVSRLEDNLSPIACFVITIIIDIITVVVAVVVSERNLLSQYNHDNYSRSYPNNASSLSLLAAGFTIDSRKFFSCEFWWLTDRNSSPENLKWHYMCLEYSKYSHDTDQVIGELCRRIELIVSIVSISPTPWLGFYYHKALLTTRL